MQPMQVGEKRRKRGDQGQDHQLVERGAQNSLIFTLGAPERGKFLENYVKGME